jgi:phosphoribosylformimino-5-aminoimidazole carboxamide ribotide isomerase
MSFTLIPAIDLRGGRCVRLLQGRLEDETVFSEDPVATARGWQAQGARRLHVVDLDGAFGGRPAQTDIIRAVIAALGIPVQVGGGLRDAPAVQGVLDAGARWAVVGTRAALDPAFLGEICDAFPGRIIVSVDASDGKVAVDGWKRVLELEATDLARDAAAAGAAAVLYTDIARDGTERGPEYLEHGGGGARGRHSRARLGWGGLARRHPSAGDHSRRGGGHRGPGAL